MTETVLLHCEFGDHDWERPKQRGARPKNCPEHTAQIEAEREEQREKTINESRLDRAKALIESQEHMYEVADEEERRQLDYIDRVISTGLGPSYTNEFINPREEADLDILTDRRTAIMKAVSRRYEARKKAKEDRDA